jgi:beta-lactamase regulating signal transducer with metallopeptidase domain
MTAFGIAIVWCALQVSIVTLIAIAADLAMKRRGRTGGSVILLAGLTGAIVLTLLIWSPWPRWSWETSVATRDAAQSPTRSTAPDSIEEADAAPGIETQSEITSQTSDVPVWSFASVTDYAGEFWNAWEAELAQANVAVADRPEAAPIWPMWIGLLIACGVAFSAVRLAWGWCAIQRDRSRSKAIHSPQLAEMCDLLRAELSITNPVEIRESPRMATAATIGWRRPLILLPLDWRTWEPAELRAVLAHELGHISRRHFPAWIVAQVALALHFYHPFMHWIVGRLRLAQELEADEDAALVNGGRRTYLESLAALAIRQADAPVSWPARAFLPTRKTFMRRIEMLRSNRPLRAPSAVMTFIACGLVLAGVTFAAGVREDVNQVASAAGNQTEQVESGTTAPVTGSPIGLAGPHQVALNQPGDDAEPDTSGITLSHIPGDAVVVAAIKPAKLMQSLSGNEDFAPVLAMFQGQDPMVELVSQAEQVTFTLSGANVAGNVGGEPEFAFTVQFADAAALESVLQQFEANEERPFANTNYRVGRGSECYWVIDDRTVLIGGEPVVQQSILSGARVRSDLVSSATWESSAASAHALIAVDVEFFAGLIPKDMTSAVMAPFTPIWEESETLTAVLTMEGSSLNAAATLECKNEEGAVTVKDTLQAVVTLARNAMAGLQRQMARPNELAQGPGGPPQVQMGAVMGRLLAMQEEFFDSLTLSAEGTSVTLTSAYEIDPAMFAVFAQGVSGARTAAANMQQQNNLKQIGLALHNYHDTHGHFPPAVIVDEASGEVHSWRVEILPYIEQAALYNSYRMNEPWDSEHNKQILAQMPPVYAPVAQRTDAAPMANHTGILAIVGEGSGFAAEGEGLQIRDFIDGTSNTLLTVDSPGELVPWTKPDDLEVTLSEDELDLGGLDETEFQALFCDGSVRTMPAMHEQSLRIFIGRDDGIPTPVIQGAFNGGTTETFLVPPTQYGFEEAQIGAFPATATPAIQVPQEEAIPVPPEGLQRPESPQRPPQP